MFLCQTAMARGVFGLSVGPILVKTTSQEHPQGISSHLAQAFTWTDELIRF